jgi:5-methylcytosine-specific restriction protein A
MNIFMMTWSPTGWPHKLLLNVVKKFHSGHKTVQWRISAHKQCRIGDKVLFFKQGKGVRGVFGYGEISGIPGKLIGVGDSSPQYYVEVQLSDIRDPLHELLIHEDKVKHLLPTNAQASGVRIANENVEQLYDLLSVAPYKVPISSSADWTADELEVAVDVYFEMLEFQQSGQHFFKAQIRKRILASKLKNRSEPSFEWRMRNISSILAEIGEPTLSGYLPARNVGSNSALSDIVKSRLSQKDIEITLTSDEFNLDVQVERLLKKYVARPEPIQAPPEYVLAKERAFLRNARVKAWVLQESNGVCEGCNLPAPFTLPNGQPFLEVHHMRPLCDAGSDSVENTVALCPNCHRRCHFSNDQEAFSDELYQRVGRLVRECNDIKSKVV